MAWVHLYSSNLSLAPLQQCKVIVLTCLSFTQCFFKSVRPHVLIGIIVGLFGRGPDRASIGSCSIFFSWRRHGDAKWLPLNCFRHLSWRYFLAWNDRKIKVKHYSSLLQKTSNIVDKNNFCRHFTFWNFFMFHSFLNFSTFLFQFNFLTKILGDRSNKLKLYFGFKFFVHKIKWLDNFFYLQDEAKVNMAFFFRFFFFFLSFTWWSETS